jgi:hydroxyacylglutathione hydrolase
MHIEAIPLLKDNYAYLLTSGAENALIDPSEAEPVIALLDSRGIRLQAILNTHHHGDHTGGNLALKQKYGCRIYGPAAEASRIPGIDAGLKEGDVLKIGGGEARILSTPGHTLGHICAWFPADGALFCGDTLFSMGCGRLFEGTAAQMWDSLEKIMALPDETLIYCGHEYTLANGAFCREVEPGNQDIADRMEQARRLRNEGKPSIPSTLATEKKTNVFLRAGNAARFAEIRTLKDNAR